MPPFDQTLTRAAQIERDLGEVKGDIKGVIAALARVMTQLDEQRAVNEAAHARQDQRILELTRSQAAIEGAHSASLRWIALVAAMLGGACGSFGTVLLRLFQK